MGKITVAHFVLGNGKSGQVMRRDDDAAGRQWLPLLAGVSCVRAAWLGPSRHLLSVLVFSGKKRT